MTDGVQIAIVTSTGALLLGAVSSYFAYKAKAVSQVTHDLVNSRMTELLEMAKKTSHAKGVLQEKQDEKKRNKR